jgi:hypothetical protein
MRQYYYQIEDKTMSKSQTQSQSLLSDGWTASPSSAADLYPIQSDSSYWEERN